MSKEGAENNTKWGRALLIAFLVGTAVIAGAVGFGSIGSAAKLPNTSGDTTNTRANPTDPKTKLFISQLQAATDPGAWLKQNRQALDDLRSATNDLENNWITNKTLQDTADHKYLTDAKTQLDIIRGDLDKLVGYINAAGTGATLAQVPNQADVMRLKEEISQAGRQIDDIVSAALGRGSGTRSAAVALANQLIQRNGDGQGKEISYDGGHIVPEITRSEVKSGQYMGKDIVSAAQAMDCSGFISYVLIGVGAMESPKDTQGLIDNTVTFTDIDDKIDTNGDGVAQEKEVTDAITNGVLQPGDVIITGLVNGKKSNGDTHAVMLLSPDLKDTHAIGQSTHPPGGKNGPQWATLDNRMSRIRDRGLGSNVTFLHTNYSDN